jgi:hypothetical protein
MLANTNLKRMTIVVLCSLSGAIVAHANETGRASDPRKKCGVTLKIVEQRLTPVIRRGNPGTDGILFGVEGGCVLKQGSIYHLCTTELSGRQWVDTKIAHWTSENRLNWTRRSTLFESSGDFTGKDQYASVWAMPLAFDESARRWNLFYIGYRSKPNDETGWYINHEGRVFRAVSEVEGRDGVAGPYKDAGVVLEPGPQSQPWEGLQGSDSFHIYRLGNRWMAFYGSAQTQSIPKPNPAYAKWNVGLTEADSINGPWRRRSAGNPVFGNAENPVVTRLSSGRYIAVFDALGDKPLFIGYADSPDGIRWSEPAYLELRAKDFWASDIRTPLSLIEEADGTFSIFYTAYTREDAAIEPGTTPGKDKPPPFACLGLVSVKVVTVL